MAAPAVHLPALLFLPHNRKETHATQDTLATSTAKPRGTIFLEEQLCTSVACEGDTRTCPRAWRAAPWPPTPQPTMMTS